MGAEAAGELFGSLLFSLLIRYIWGAICKKVATDKGYSGSAWFWWGFFFTLLALIIICVKQNQSVPYHTGNVNAIREYKQLLDSGVITQEEFERKKAELLKYNQPTYYTPPQYNNAANNGKKWVCPECGNVNPPGVWVCESCGREK